MKTELTPEAQHIIEEIKSKLIEGGQQSVAYISGLQYALTNRELLKAQGLISNELEDYESVSIGEENIIIPIYQIDDK